MRTLVLLVFFSILFTSLKAQRKMNLYIQLSSELGVSNDLNFTLVTPPHPSSKKVKVLSIDSLIDYETINTVIRKMDYKGVRILSELSLLGWKLESTSTAPKIEGKVFGDPRVIFILSKEVIIGGK